MELAQDIYVRVLEFCKQGDASFESNDYNSAIKNYNDALNLIPMPQNDWAASTWIYTALGDIYFITEDYRNASDYFFNAINCPNGDTNPFVLLRLGQSLYEINKVNEAKEYLLRAFALEGETVFEDEEPKYFDLIRE